MERTENKFHKVVKFLKNDIISNFFYLTEKCEIKKEMKNLDFLLKRDLKLFLVSALLFAYSIFLI